MRQWRFPAAVGLVWALVAWGSIELRESKDGVLLLWLPSAVAVSALAGTQRAQWPRILVCLVAGNLAIGIAHGFPLATLLGFGAAQAIEATLCVSIGRRLLGRHVAPQTLRHLAGIFFAAVIASFASTLIALPFRPRSDFAQQAWWFLATVLGMMVGTPILANLRQVFEHRTKLAWASCIKASRPLLGVLAGSMILTLLVLAGNSLAMVPLLFCGLVFAVLQSGQKGASVALFGFAVSATVGEQTGLVQTATFGFQPFAAGLVLQGYMLLMLMTSLPLASALLARKKLENSLRRRNQDLHGNMKILKLAKSLAGIGRWQYDCDTGAQSWSPEMLKLNGLPSDLGSDPGNLRDLLPDGGEALFAHLAQHREARQPYTFEYSIRTPSGSERILKMNAFNEFVEERRKAIFAVAMDVTEERRRERMLDLERANAMRLALEARQLANTDVLTGLANRRCALEKLGALLRDSRVKGYPFSLVMFDIDHFKGVNDTHGHAVGDAILVGVAEICRRLVRPGDLIGRIGGEEFVWLLPNLAMDPATRLAEGLRNAIAEASMGDGMPPVTISVGVASRRDDDTIGELLGRADAALYGAKDDGRNRVRRAA